MWHKALQAARNNDQIVMLGVIQEQHAERCRLFAQWQKFDWPIVQDPNNLLGLRAVPIVVAIDEVGTIQYVNPRVQDVTNKFLSKQAVDTDAPNEKVSTPDISEFQKAATQNPTADAWRELGDNQLLWGGDEAISKSIQSYQKASTLRPDDADLYFRLGVAYRKRYDLRDDNTSNNKAADSNDFRLAIEHWQKALDINPNQYIYRRRIQQYGPRLIKPYPFYDWIARAQKDIKSRGQKPIALTVGLSGAELASPSRQFIASTEKQAAPDPKAKINRDIDRLIRARVVVVPAPIRPGQSCRVHVEFEPTSGAHWNNEAEPLRVWIELPAGWQSERQLFEISLPKKAESTERRSLDFEVRPNPQQKTPAQLKAYALYYVCKQANGTCLFLRQDLEISIDIRE